MPLARRYDFPAPDGDSPLVQRAQAGDIAALDALIEAHREQLERVVQYFVRNAEDAQDVTQEAWLRAATHIRDLRDPGRFRAWLRTIARNSCMAFLKRQHTRDRTGSLDDTDAPEIADSEAATAEEYLLARDEQRKVWETLGGLAERDRVAILDRDQREMPYAEIARHLGLSRNAAEACVSRARERFRRLYRRIDAADEECEVSGLQLSMYLLDELDDLSDRRVMRHLQACDRCLGRLGALYAGWSAYQSVMRPAA